MTGAALPGSASSALPDAALLRALIEGLSRDPPWGQFLDMLRAMLRADYCSITFRPFAPGTPPPGGVGLAAGPSSRVVHLASGRQSPPIVARLYRESLYDEDPMPYHQMAEGRVHALPELIREGEPVHEAYRQRLLAPSGMNVLRIMRLEEPSGVSAWLTVSREAGEFTRADEDLIAALAPWLRPALAAFVTLERERAAARVAGEAMARMNFAWVTLDAAGRVLDHDRQGADLFSARGPLRRGRDGRLTAREPQVARDIAVAVRALGLDPGGPPRALVLSREPWLDMLLVPASAQVRARGLIGPEAIAPHLIAPQMIAYVHADRWSSADRAGQIAALFDLLPSEARLALALSRGMSIAEAAGELGLTVESARTYSKRIYAKTGARGQADLVRFVHRSVLAMA